MFNPLVLFKVPEINPINKKAKTIPALNPINLYGRVFTFAWVGFFLAFLSWYELIHSCLPANMSGMRGLL
jgi:MFS transporter, NNP family, nitrate/nitrite transporter